MRKFELKLNIEVTEDVKDVMHLYKIQDDFIKIANKYNFKCSGELKELK